jgi:hypothetical protein
MIFSENRLRLFRIMLEAGMPPILPIDFAARWASLAAGHQKCIGGSRLPAGRAKAWKAL